MSPISRLCGGLFTGQSAGLALLLSGREDVTSRAMWNILTAMILSAGKNIGRDIFQP